MSIAAAILKEVFISHRFADKSFSPNAGLFFLDHRLQ